MVKNPFAAHTAIQPKSVNLVFTSFTLYGMVLKMFGTVFVISDVPGKGRKIYKF
jgi:hypothetical protein